MTHRPSRASRVMRMVRVAAALAVLWPPLVTAQELEPRAYSPSPVGTTFVGVSASRSAGGVFTDPSAPIEDVEATVGVLGLAAGRTFGLAGRQVLVFAILPVVWGEASGQVGEDRRGVSRRGLGDARVRASIILAGSPAMSPDQFARRARRPIVGASLTVAPPTGQYDSTKLVNLGANRWSVKPEVGLSVPAGRWTLDTYASVWWFSDNPHYYPGGNLREQAPILALQGHVSRTLGRRAWLAANLTWYRGGTTRINGVNGQDLQQNTRLGATWSLPVGARQSIKLSYSAGATTRIGADFRTVAIAWQMVVF